MYSQFVFGIPWWMSLCGRSLVDIVKILLCEGGDVEQWLEPRNIFLRLHLDLSISQLSTLYILHCYYCSYIYMLDIVCVHTLVFNQESY